MMIATTIIASAKVRIQAAPDIIVIEKSWLPHGSPPKAKPTTLKMISGMSVRGMAASIQDGLRCRGGPY